MSSFRTFAVFGLFAAALPAAAFDLTVIHTNDTHAFFAGNDASDNPCYEDSTCTGGFARMAAFIKSERAKNPVSLYLDAGDAWQGTPFFSVLGESLTADLLNRLAPDAGTLGNHEFDHACKKTAEYVNRLSFPVLAANLAPQKECALSGHPNIAPSIVKNVNGLKVGIIGIANDEVIEISSACPHTRFIPTKEALQRAADNLKAQGVNIIIALTHVGYPVDIELAKTVEGVDIYVGGHSHYALETPGAPGPYPTLVKTPSGNMAAVVTAGNTSRYVGVLKASFDENGRLTSASGKNVLLLSEFPRDAEMQKAVKDASLALKPLIEQHVAISDVEDPNAIENCRKNECVTGSLTADAFLAFGRKYGADIALINSGSIRAGMHRGNISRADLLSQHPFPDGVCVAKLSGRDIRAALEHGLSADTVEKPQLLQTSGLRYLFELSQPAGKRLKTVEVKSNTEHWVPLSDEKHYTAVMPGYLCTGGDGFSMLVTPVPINAGDRPDALHIFESYLKEMGRISVPESGRLISH